MRLALFTDTPRMGGAERVLVDLAQAAHAAGNEVHVLAPQAWLIEELTTLAPAVEGHVVASDAFRTSPSRARSAISLVSQGPRLACALHRLAPDVLFINNGGFPGSDLCRLAAICGRAARVPGRALMVHALPRPRAESQPQLQALVDCAVWRSVDAVVGATSVVRERLVVERGMPDSLFVQIPYGVPEPPGEAEAEAVRAALAEPRELLVGMISATSDEQKGHAVLVEALGVLPGVRGVIVGADPPDAVQQRVVELSLGQRVTQVGRVESVGPYLHAIDVLVVPSVADESLPLVVLEAMSTGTPVVASDLSGIPEAVEDAVTGRLFPPGDAGALAAILRELNDDRGALERLGAAARSAWRQRFSVATMIGASLALFERLAQAR